MTFWAVLKDFGMLTLIHVNNVTWLYNVYSVYDQYIFVPGWPEPNLHWYKVLDGGNWEELKNDDKHTINILLNHANILQPHVSISLKKYSFSLNFGHTASPSKKRIIHFDQAEYSKLRGARWLRIGPSFWRIPYFSSSPIGFWVLGVDVSV